jgi:hypothetical protein
MGKITFRSRCASAVGYLSWWISSSSTRADDGTRRKV